MHCLTDFGARELDALRRECAELRESVSVALAAMHQSPEGERLAKKSGTLSIF